MTHSSSKLREGVCECCSFFSVKWNFTIYLEATSQASDNEEQFDVKSDEIPAATSELRDLDQPARDLDQPARDLDQPTRDLDQPTPDLALPIELHHNLNLDLHSPDDPPVDMLSPISETTEPGGSAGNSLNNSMSTSHEQQEFRRQGHKNPGGGSEVDLSPPTAQTPRKSNNQSLARDSSIPRGSYVISDSNHTPESAFAAGIPVVERVSRASTSVSHSSDEGLLYGSGSSEGLTNGVHERSNDARESSNTIDKRYVADARGSSNFHDQQSPSGASAREQTGAPEQRCDNSYLTFTKSKSRGGMGKGIDSKDSGYAESTDCYGDIHKGLVKTSAEIEDGKKSAGPSITWFSQAKNEERSVGDGGQRLESAVRKTNWGEMASEVDENSSGKGKMIFYFITGG